MSAHMPQANQCSKRQEALQPLCETSDGTLPQRLGGNRDARRPVPGLSFYVVFSSPECPLTAQSKLTSCKTYKGIMSRDGLAGEMDAVSPMKRKGRNSHSFTQQTMLRTYCAQTVCKSVLTEPRVGEILNRATAKDTELTTVMQET